MLVANSWSDIARRRQNGENRVDKGLQIMQPENVTQNRKGKSRSHITDTVRNAPTQNPDASATNHHRSKRKWTKNDSNSGQGEKRRSLTLVALSSRRLLAPAPSSAVGSARSGEASRTSTRASRLHPPHKRRAAEASPSKLQSVWWARRRGL